MTGAAKEIERAARAAWTALHTHRKNCTVCSVNAADTDRPMYVNCQAAGILLKAACSLDELVSEPSRWGLVDAWWKEAAA